jgi:hemerythrin superfamily protein
MARAQKRSASRSKTSNRSRSSTRAKTKTKTSTRRSGSNGAQQRRTANSRPDAIALLKADHRQVEELFESFEKARTSDRKRTLATEICTMLRVHAQIEEEIFYPAFFEATQEEDLHHEAVIEHDGAKKLIAEIESSGPDDEYFDARVSVLSEMIKHHVREEESREGLFGKSRGSGMDLAEIGERLAARKAELESEPGLLKTAKQIKDAGKGLVSRVLGEV